MDFPTVEKEFFRRVSPRMKGTRLDQYITQSGIGLTRSQVEKLIHEGRVQVNGVVVRKPGYRVKPGDEVYAEFELQMNHPMVAQPELELSILYEDEDLVLIDKPVGMVVHPARGNFTGTLVNALLGRYAQLPTSSDRIRPGIVHRLDKDTSGVMVVAKSERGLRSLYRQIETKTARREYLAVVWGVPPHRQGTVEAPIGRHPIHRTRMAVTPLHSKPAITHYEVREVFGGVASLLRVQLETGRTHQIRVHMEYLGHPVVGDPTYGGRETRKIFRVVDSRHLDVVRRVLGIMDRQALHAWRLTLEHPATGRVMTFEAPLPEDMQQLLHLLRKWKETL
jgi:23S rRNA pseudouridine1911/1915/1917 synthase